MTSTIDRTLQQLIEEKGWRAGTSLENRVALRLHRYGFRPEDVAQQHRVGRYRLDFAWVDLKIALEADGPHHLLPTGAERDARRDRELRLAGWLVLRVNDADEDTLADQLVRVARAVRSEV